MARARWPRGWRQSRAAAGSPRTPAGALRGCAGWGWGDRAEGRGAKSPGRGEERPGGARRGELGRGAGAVRAAEDPGTEYGVGRSRAGL